MKYGGGITVNKIPMSISYNWLPIMDKINQIGFPSKITIDLQIKYCVVSWIRGEEYK